MQYGQVILFVVFCFAIYYIVMIVMDLQKANAAKLAEAENNKEEDIDISDEAKQFNPIKITREIKPRTPLASDAEIILPHVDDVTPTEQTKENDVPNGKENISDQKWVENPLCRAKAEQTPDSTSRESPTDNKPNSYKPQEKEYNNKIEKEKEMKPQQNHRDPEKEETEAKERQPLRINLRKPVMTDGINAEKLVEDLNAGRDVIEKELGAVIMSCEHAKDED